MKMLFTSLPLTGHVHGMLPVAQAARRLGHDIAFCGPASVEATMADAGVPLLVSGTDQIAERMRHLEECADLSNGDFDRFIEQLVTEILPYQAVPAGMKAVEETGSAWCPDVIVRDACDFGALLAAERLGLPHVSVATVSGTADFLHPAITAALNARRREFGIPEDPSGIRAYANLHANLIPAWLDPGELGLPNARFYRHVPAVSRHDRLPEWIANLPADRPIVYISFGTIVVKFRSLQPIIELVIESLRDNDVTLVVSGRGLPELYGKAFPEANIVSDICQWQILNCADLFITHGGFNSVREALGAGIPMIGIPTNIEFAHSLQLCAALGCATVLDWKDLTAQTVSTACTNALIPAVRDTTRRVATRLRTVPPIDSLIEDISAMVKSPVKVTLS